MIRKTYNITSPSGGPLYTPKYLPARMYNFYQAEVNISTPGALFTKWMIPATDDTSGSAGYGSQMGKLASIGLLGSGLKAVTHGNTSYPDSEMDYQSQIGAHCTESYKILIAGYYRFTCSMAFVSNLGRTNIRLGQPHNKDRNEQGD